MKIKCKTAFTLAEVLITLAIIGVVAVITIPTMVAGNKEKAWNTAATVFEKRLNETLKVMNIEGTLEGYTSTKDFVNALSRHLKITKTCDNTNLTSCFSDKVYWDVIDISKNGTVSDEVDVSNVKTAADLGQDDWNTEVVGFQLNNGTNGLIAYNPDCEVDKFDANANATSCVAVVYDTSGFSKPNNYPKDMRAINATLGECAFKSGSTCFGTPFFSTPLTKAECEAEKGNLGINECYYDNDYWAGAVKACGGTNKMATMAQLAEIANYFYNTDQVQTYNNVQNITMDLNGVSSLGFTLNSSYQFDVWSGEENSYNNACYRYFYLTGTRYGCYSRGDNYRQAVCLGD